MPSVCASEASAPGPEAGPHRGRRGVEGGVRGRGAHAGAEPDAFGALAGGGQKHLRRCDGLPARGMMLAAPEFIVAECIELLDQIEVAAKLQHRMLANRVMRGEKGSEFQARHGFLSRLYCSW